MPRSDEWKPCDALGLTAREIHPVVFEAIIPVGEPPIRLHGTVAAGPR